MRRGELVHGGWGASVGRDASANGASDAATLGQADGSQRDDDSQGVAVPPSPRDDSASAGDGGDDTMLDDADAAADAGGDDGGGDLDDAGYDGGASVPPAGFTLPLDIILITQAVPVGMTGSRDTSLVQGILRYENAYDGADLITDGRVFRFLARTFDAAGDAPGDGVSRVWWSVTNTSTDMPSSFVCYGDDDGSYALMSLNAYGMAEPESAYKTACSWELIRFETVDGDRYELRQPYLDSKVSTTHADADEGNRVRLGGSFDARFDLVSPVPPAD